MNEDITVASDTAAEDGIAGSAPAASDSLETQLEAATARADENYNKFLLAVADFDNYKKRMERQLTERVQGSRKKLLQQFLPVLDNLERALSYDEANASLRGGVQQTLKGFEAALQGEGVTSFSVKGEAFDPTIAEAIGTIKAEGVEDDIVVEELQRGYRLGDDLLRPASVIVAKNGD